MVLYAFCREVDVVEFTVRSSGDSCLVLKGERGGGYHATHPEVRAVQGCGRQLPADMHEGWCLNRLFPFCHVRTRLAGWMVRIQRGAWQLWLEF